MPPNIFLSWNSKESVCKCKRESVEPQTSENNVSFGMFCQVQKSNGYLFGNGYVSWFLFTRVSVKDQEPPTRELIKQKLWGSDFHLLGSLRRATLLEEPHCWKIFLPPFKEHFRLRITSPPAGLTHSLTLVVIGANHWCWEGGFLHLNKTIQALESVNPWKALQFHSLTCLINMEIVKMFWLVKNVFSLLKERFGPNMHKTLAWHAWKPPSPSLLCIHWQALKHK